MGKNKRQLIVNNDLIREFMTNVNTYLPDFKEPEDLEPEVSEQEDILAEIKDVLAFKGMSVPYGDYVWKKLTAENGDFVDYIVSSDENAYPDGDMQDGMYYVKFNPETVIAENIREGVDIFGILGTLIEGKAGIDFGEVTVSTETQNVTVQHNLGVAPSFVVMVSTTAYSSGYMWANINGIALRKYSSSIYTTMANTVTDKEITFKAYSSSYGWYGHHRWFAIV